MKARTKEFERRMAISRHPKYIREYDKLQVIQGSGERQKIIGEFLEKLKEHPKLSDKNLDDLVTEHRKKLQDLPQKQKTMQGFEKDMIQKWRANPLPVPYFPNGFIEPTSFYKDPPSVSEVKKINAIPDPFKSGILFLQVDITQNQTKLVTEFKKLISVYLGKTPAKKNKRFHCDIFMVYDQKHREGLNFNQIARNASGISGHPSYNPELDKWLHRIKNAYKKAKEKINQVVA